MLSAICRVPTKIAGSWGARYRAGARWAAHTLRCEQIVIGFPITFGQYTSTLPIVVGFPITFGPYASTLPIVVGFSPTFGPRAQTQKNREGRKRPSGLFMMCKTQIIRAWLHGRRAFLLCSS